MYIFRVYEEIPNNGVGDRFSGAEGDIPISSIISSNNNEKFINFSLKLSDNSDYIIPVKNDGYVNVTKICQAAGKRLQNYKDRVDSKYFLDRYIALTGIQANAIFEVVQGGNLANVEQGTFAHPDIAIHIAQWCSADFSIQVSRWIRELLTIGKVEIGNELNTEEINNILKKKIEEQDKYINQINILIKDSPVEERLNRT